MLDERTGVFVVAYFYKLSNSQGINKQKQQKNTSVKHSNTYNNVSLRQYLVVALSNDVTI